MLIFYSHPKHLVSSFTRRSLPVTPLPVTGRLKFNSLQKRHPEKTQDARWSSHLRPGSRLSTHLEASALPASSVPLPASSPRAFAGAEAVLAWSRREAACAAAVAGAPAVLFVEPELVGFGSARDDCLVVPRADDSPRGGYWVASARDDCLVAPRAGDSPRGGYWVDSARDDCLVAPRADDSPRGDCSAALVPADFPAGLPVG